jgi:23S rRNA (guanosine2251-2'-O)-methyltransferase
MFSDPKVGDIWLGLDGVQDSRNIGAIARTAQFFGVRGIVLTRDRTAPITAISHDVAAGGLEVLKISQPPNLSKALSEIRSLGVWIVGTAEDAEANLQSLKPDRPWLILVGNEEKGLRRLTREACDLMVSLPSNDQFVSSLNVSVAAGITISSLKI